MGEDSSDVFNRSFPLRSNQRNLKFRSRATLLAFSKSFRWKAVSSSFTCTLKACEPEVKRFRCLLKFLPATRNFLLRVLQLKVSRRRLLSRCGGNLKSSVETGQPIESPKLTAVEMGSFRAFSGRFCTSRISLTDFLSMESQMASSLCTSDDRRSIWEIFSPRLSSRLEILRRAEFKVSLSSKISPLKAESGTVGTLRPACFVDGGG